MINLKNAVWFLIVYVISVIILVAFALFVFEIIGCSIANPSEMVLAKQNQQVSFNVWDFPEIGSRNTNFTLHESLIDSLGAGGLLLVDIVSSSNCCDVSFDHGLVIPIDSLIFIFDVTQDSIDYTLSFSTDRRVPPPIGTVLETWSPENLDNAVDTDTLQATENWLYYIRN